MSEGNSSGKGVITIKKENLWKYSTFILIIVLVIGAFIFFGKTNTSNTNTNTNTVAGNVVANATPVDLNVFANDASKYPSLGPENAKVTIIEFSDFQCPYCAIAAGLSDFAKQYSTGQYADLFGSAGKLQQLASSGKIRFIYVPMSFLGQESVNAAEAALCANEKGKFFDMHDAIFAANDGKEGDGKYSIDKLKTIASSISGLDQTKFTTCLDSNKYSSIASQIDQTANLAGVQGTPTMFLNGVSIQPVWSSISTQLASNGITV